MCIHNKITYELNNNTIMIYIEEEKQEFLLKNQYKKLKLKIKQNKIKNKVTEIKLLYFEMIKNLNENQVF